jgi:hypothetical protein
MRKLLLLAFLFGGFTAFSQGTVSGLIMDSDLGGPLAGANIIETGTTNGTIADMDGRFNFKVTTNSGTVSISYLGYKNSTVAFSLSDGSADLGSLSIEIDAAALDEIVIIGTGIIDLAEGRRTPSAVSTIRSEEIQAKITGNTEFTEVLKNTPSVYVSNQAGGFGDSQIFLRGFNDSNTAFLLNGQPINSVEDGRIFWSNWSGMTDVASAVQAQRGLGSSKLAISSVGGTVNIISKSTDSRQGGFVRFLTGNDSYFKGTASYSTGVNESGWAFSFLIDHWQAHRKYSEGTAGQGQNYLFSVGYKMNNRNTFNFLITGAPQWHDQNFSDSLEDYAQYGEKYNANSGFKDGTRFTERRNFYHKPVANLNWDLDLNEKIDVSTVLYASWGRGGGTGALGRGTRVRNDMGQIDFDQIVQNNIADANNGIGNNSDSRIIRSSMNNHNWYGLISNVTYKASEELTLNVGIDGRLYRGDHFRQLNDLLGLTGFQDNYRNDRPDDYVISSVFEADPWSALFDFADEANRTQYDYSENINNIGGFAQAEYVVEHFSGFLQGAVSSQSFQREGRFSGTGNGLGKSEKLSKTGYNVKGGAAYMYDGNHSVFANGGYFSRQPYLDNIFADIRNSNDFLSPDVENEEITGFEAGYRFKNRNLKVSLDFYITTWANRFLAFNGPEIDPDGVAQTSTYRLTDVTQRHRGFEFDVEYSPDMRDWSFHAFGSIGNWKYDGDSPYTLQNDENGTFIPQVSDKIDLTGTLIGNAPQTSFGFGGTLKICDGLSVDADYNIYTDLYGFVDPEDVAQNALSGGGTFQAEKLPAYSLLDAGVTYKFLFGDKNLTFRANLKNVGNTSYLGQRDAFGYYLGVGRTYNASMRYNF